MFTRALRHTVVILINDACSRLVSSLRDNRVFHPESKWLKSMTRVTSRCPSFGVLVNQPSARTNTDGNAGIRGACTLNMSAAGVRLQRHVDQQPARPLPGRESVLPSEAAFSSQNSKVIIARAKFTQLRSSTPFKS